MQVFFPHWEAIYINTSQKHLPAPVLLWEWPDVGQCCLEDFLVQRPNPTSGFMGAGRVARARRGPSQAMEAALCLPQPVTCFGAAKLLQGWGGVDWDEEG